LIMLRICAFKCYNRTRRPRVYLKTIVRSDVSVRGGVVYGRNHNEVDGDFPGRFDFKRRDDDARLPSTAMRPL